VLKAQFQNIQIKRGGNKRMKIKLNAARVNAGLTQEDVAKRLGKSKNTIVSWEKGKSSPDIETGKALAKMYGVSVNDLIFLPNDCALSTIKEGSEEK
jgi:DNA-binding XRE family transcriptional regulator